MLSSGVSTCVLVLMQQLLIERKVLGMRLLLAHAHRRLSGTPSSRCTDLNGNGVEAYRHLSRLPRYTLRFDLTM
jgi:hypothetical protein